MTRLGCGALTSDTEGLRERKQLVSVLSTIMVVDNLEVDVSHDGDHFPRSLTEQASPLRIRTFSNLKISASY
jgi:hypothetical protein